MKPYRTTNGLVPVANVAAQKTFRVRVARGRDDAWVATCPAPVCMSRAASEAEALEKIRAEIRYRVEYCPCTGVGEDYVQLEVERAPG